MSRGRNQPYTGALSGILCAVLLTAACGGASSGDTPLPPAATAEPTPTAEPATPAEVAESRYLPQMSPTLAETVRSQPWFESAEQGHLRLIAAILECERAAGPRGEKDSVAAALDYAAEQLWYTDGLDESEALGLRGVFLAYKASLSDQWAPQIGPVLSTTIEYKLFQVVEGTDVTVLVSAVNPQLGRQALDLTIQYLPDVEAIVGEFPYDFLHITVTELFELYAGLSYDEFISLAPDSVTNDVVVHEVTHSTMYAIFPTWFEEGFAHFMEYYLTDRLDEGVAYFTDQLALLDSDTRLNIGPRPGYDFGDHLIDRATGFLFVKGLYDVGGIENVVDTIKELRSKTFSNQQLVKRLVDSDDPELRAALAAFVCESVIGTTHDYCSD